MTIRFPRALWQNRELCWRLAEREVLGRYRGSLLGLAWSFLTPLAMLAVYTFVFSQVFKARWGTLENQGPLGFAVNLFAGLIVFNLFAECANRAPTLVLANPSYVKKIVFPLEILAGVSVGSAGFHALTSLVVLAIFELIAFRGLPYTFIWLPLVWVPLILGCLAFTWVIAALGVFLRDIGQLVGVIVSMLMFLSPVFFPVSALPLQWQPILTLNPLAQVIEQTRMVVIAGEHPQASYLIAGTLIAGLACELSFRLFQKTKRAFADVM
ncbi:ABC transporter permease [Synechococcus sp. ATX 2A4]|uniref:ABC transporter permease n=1 Tax=Synechococcus sp. ATX 2A4 TaxID=2823727 RepID=UPI0020CD3DCB|nr:ABC transporter permease [Synechococcus sp. ATX 2A4]MCP9885393.1 ABC transporter permease [Synechococcus sp. ATX 2A4]